MSQALLREDATGATPENLIPANEPERLAAVTRYDILGTPPNGAFDRITAIAARLFNVPISIVSIVDRDRIWFKSHHGLSATGAGRDPGLCASAILRDEPRVLPDARCDVHALANPLVAGEFGLRFYAGVPLRTTDGFNLGTLCVIGKEPREVSAEEIAQLKDLASVVMDQLELRRSARGALAAAERTEDALRESQEQLQIALAASDTGTFRWNPCTGEFLAFDNNLKRLFGFAPGDPVRVTDDFIVRVHPDDVSGLVAAINRCRDGADLEMEYRVIHPDGSIRWLFDRAKIERDSDGNPTYLVGACTDITHRKQIETQRTQIEAAAREAAQRFLFMAETMPQKLFTANANGDVDYFNQQWTEFTGLTFDQIRDWGWTQFIHPDDVEENIRVWQRSIETGEPFEFVHRFRRADGAYRWHLSRARAMRNAVGNISKWIGSNTEIHEQKELHETLRQREEAVRLLLREMNHRVKNLFALAGSVVTLSARTAGTPKELAEAVRERLAALARAHELTLPDIAGGGGKSGQATSLPALVRTIVSPYVTQGDARIIIVGPDVPIGGSAVTSLALLLHEIATNAAKYGALSTESGHVDVSWSVWKDELLLAWRERGGPPLNGQPKKEGFGSLLARLTVTGQLAGKISRDWNADGLTVNLSAPLVRLTI
ncbi:MAG: PAS domain-containing protein [Methylocella sp.]|nr:MAG: hypothetical protein DLM68_16445 [Hyphomicrobiales bacterium]